MKKSTKIYFPEWPHYDEHEESELIETLKSRNWWRMAGHRVQEFEEKFSRLHSVDYALGVTNGTHAIELALMALNIRPGEEIIVPAFTFISTALPIMRLGAIPIPVDVDPKTYCLDPDAVEQAISSKTKGIIPVHMAGHICDMDRIMEIASKHELFVIEDACHAHGGEWKGRRAGSIGNVGVFSFQALKLMTAGEGGALITNSQDLHDQAFLYNNVGRPANDRVYQHLVQGSNYRLSEFQAAVLLPQIERLDEQNALREKNAGYLDQEMNTIKGIEPQGRREECNIHTHYMYMFDYEPEAFGGMPREQFVERLNEVGIPAYRSYSLVQDTPLFQDFVEKVGIERFGNGLHCPHARRIADRAIWIHHRVLLGDKATALSVAEIVKEIQQGANMLV